MTKPKKVAPKQSAQAKLPETWAFRMSLQNKRIEHLLTVIGNQARRIATLEADVDEFRF